MGLDHSLTIRDPKGQEVVNFQWRKRNHFHKWWVDRYPDGDNGGAKVEGADILEFYVACRDVLLSLNKGELDTQTVPNGETYTRETGWVKHTRQATKFKNIEVAEELMPPQAGFFFGPTVIDDWYYQSLQDVVDKIKPFIDDLEMKPDSYDGQYGSWW